MRDVKIGQGKTAPAKGVAMILVSMGQRKAKICPATSKAMDFCVEQTWAPKLQLFAWTKGSKAAGCTTLSALENLARC